MDPDPTLIKSKENVKKIDVKIRFEKFPKVIFVYIVYIFVYRDICAFFLIFLELTNIVFKSKIVKIRFEKSPSQISYILSIYSSIEIFVLFF